VSPAAPVTAFTFQTDRAKLNQKAEPNGLLRGLGRPLVDMRDVDTADADLTLSPVIRGRDFAASGGPSLAGRSSRDRKPEACSRAISFNRSTYTERTVAPDALNRRHARPCQPFQAVPMLAGAQFPIERPTFTL
jgi:hypothetical protein